jgi:hypothetical protein
MAEGSRALCRIGTALALTLVGAGVWPIKSVQSAVRVADDRIDHAPVERKFASRAGTYVMTVSSVQSGPVRRAVAVLRDAKGRVRWRVPLPHEGGPRAAVVSDDGAALFVDEWINVIPRHALMVVDPAGKVIADHAGESILTLLAVSRRTIGQQARVGPWRSTDAVLNAAGAEATLRAGGRTIKISLKTGAIQIDR